MQQLERLLGTALLHRSAAGVHVTGAGEAFLPEAETVLAQLDRALDTVRATQGPATVRVGFAWLLPGTWMQKTLRRLEGHDIAVTVHRVDDVPAAVTTGRVDVGVLRGPVPHTFTGGHHLLHEERRVLACSTRSPLAARKSVQWSQVPTWPLVVNTVSGTTGPWSWPDGDGPHHLVRTTNFDEWLESVAADHGIGVVPASAARRTTHPGVAFIPLHGAPLVPVHLLTPPNNQHVPATPALRTFLTCAAPNRGPAPRP